ncbi:unknown [Coraliomargarita sp. CAG:312]|nr:unknown [Coraliomargarita sp. CAG:312]
MRRENLLVSLRSEKFKNKILKALADNCALGFPKDKALPDTVDYCKKSHFLAELAVIPKLCLFHLLQVLFQFLFGGECCSINALKLLVLFVSPMVGAGYR